MNIAIYMSSNQQEQKLSIDNPKTGRSIKYGSATYKKLIVSGDIKEYHNPTYPTSTTSTDKVCCQNQTCHLDGQVCCLHGDQRLIIQAGDITYAKQTIYKDGRVLKEMIDYAWKHYCPNCVSKCHRDQKVSDIRSMSVPDKSGFGWTIVTWEVKH